MRRMSSSSSMIRTCGDPFIHNPFGPNNRRRAVQAALHNHEASLTGWSLAPSRLTDLKSIPAHQSKATRDGTEHVKGRAMSRKRNAREGRGIGCGGRHDTGCDLNKAA